MSSDLSIKQDFTQLPRFQKRHFLPENASLAEVAEINCFYEDLIKREVKSAQELHQWILDRGELEAALDQVGSILYVRMTCQTDDQEKASQYTKFIETVLPAIKPLTDQLNQKLIALAATFKLDEEKYGLYLKKIKTDIELFKSENVPLQTKLDILSQEYQTVCGAMMVEFDGKERTLPEMGKFILEPNRELRERSWKATAKRRLQDKDKLESIFDQMLALRHQIAINAGCQNFIEYKFRSLHRFDYTPKDCHAYHDAIEQHVVPLYASILENRRQQMKLSSLRPWDTSVDPLGRPPLRPFDDIANLVSGCHEIFDKVDPQLGAQFADMRDQNLLDLASRKGKAPGGYQTAFTEMRKPFIFMNSVGVDSDVRTLLHEGGHAFHTLACANEELLDYRHGPMEFNEVASMGMELLGGEFMEVFYSDEEHHRSHRIHLEDVVWVLVWVAVVDAFQHWIYANPQHTREERKNKWLEIHNRFGGSLIDWSGFEEEHAYLWHRQLHVFEVPFYYIEYGIAQLGALQLWFNAKKNWALAIEQYKKALSLGGSRALPELYRTAGLVFDFSEKNISPLMTLVKNELAKNKK